MATEGSCEGNWRAFISEVSPSPLFYTDGRWLDVSRDLGWELVLI